VRVVSAETDLDVLDSFAVVVDPDAEPGNVIPTLARLLIDLARGQQASNQAGPGRGPCRLTDQKRLPADSPAAARSFTHTGDKEF